jgi:hypothetical protein
LEAKIRALHAEKVYPTLTDIKNMILELFNKVLNPSTFYGYIAKLPFKVIRGCPMEAPRTEVEPTEIHDYYKRLEAAIEGVPVEFIYNVDESGEGGVVGGRRRVP